MDVLTGWDSAAPSYLDEQERSEYADSNKTVVRNRFKDLSGVKTLDLGCGYGYYTDYFRSVGADVIGIDGSASMIDLARSRYPHCRFSVADITKPLGFPDKSFDLLFCNQVLMDIEDIEPVISEIRRLIKDGGTFYFSIVHPAFYDAPWLKDEKDRCRAKRVEKYLSRYSLENGFWGRTMHFHRPLSYYFNLMSRSGLSLKHIDEPVTYDGVNKNSDLPLFLFAEYGPD